MCFPDGDRLLGLPWALWVAFGCIGGAPGGIWVSLGSLWEVWATPGTLQEYALVEVKPPFSRNLGAQSRIASGTHSGVVLGYLLEAFGRLLSCFGVHLIAFGCPLSSFRVRMESFEVPLGDFWDPLGSFSCHKSSFYVNLMYLVRYLEDFGEARSRPRAARPETGSRAKH